jgi:Flp pilus assembly pilin Flp
LICGFTVRFRGGSPLILKESSRSRASGETLPLACKLARNERGAEVIETALLLGMIVCAYMFCITALDKKIVGRWNAIDNFFGAV